MGKSSKSEPTQNQVAIKWAVRVFVLGTLVLMLVLAFIEYRARSNSQATADLWFDKHGELIAGNECRLGVLEDIAVGNPSRRTGQLSDLEDPRESRGVRVYEWKGAFNTYAIYVGVLDFQGVEEDNLVVETIEGATKL
jgi:hypothetical protein